MEKGIILVPEGGQLFPEMTVLENLLLGAYTRRASQHKNESLMSVYSLFPKLKSLNKQKVPTKTGKERSVVVISVKNESKAKTLELSAMLRKAGLPVEVEVMGRAVSRALADADRRGVAYAVIVGPEELKEEKVVLREMKKREQRTVEISNLTEEILASSP